MSATALALILVAAVAHATWNLFSKQASVAGASSFVWLMSLAATGLYAPVVAVSVLLGLVIQYSPISPMRALFWSAIINGVVAVPLMVVIILLAQKKSVMGEFPASRPIVVLAWIAALVMGAAALRMVIPG